MSLIAEVDSALMKDAGRVAAAAELMKIVLIAGRSALAPKFVASERVLAAGKVTAEIKQEGKVARRKDVISTTLTFQFRSREQSNPKTPFVSVEGTFLAEYRTAQGFNPSRKELQAFLRANAVFNCWPYWREFVQSSISRMDLPPITLPFFRVVTKKEPPLTLDPKKKATRLPQRGMSSV